VISFVKEYLLKKWEDLSLGAKPDELFFVKFADRRIRAAEVGIISFLVKGRYGKEEKPLFILRIPRYPENREANRSLELEYQNLKTIHDNLTSDNLRQTIPRVVVWEAIGGARVLALSFLPGDGINRGMIEADLVATYLRQAEPAFYWLMGWQQGMGNAALITVEQLVERVIGEYNAIFPEKVAARAGYFSKLRDRARELGDVKVPQFVQHGDFHAENIFVGGDKVTGVIDWEDFSLTGIPGFDLFHFVRTYFEALFRYAVGGLDLALLDDLSTGDKTFKAIRVTLLDYFKKMGIDARFESLWVPLGLIQSANLAGSPRKQARAALGLFELLFQLEPFSLEELFCYMSIVNYRDLAKKAVDSKISSLANSCLERIKAIQERAK
jgi:hypothetical protein